MRRAGFTLLEAVVVIAILAAIAGLVASSLGETEDQAARSAARAELETLRKACVQFKLDDPTNQQNKLPAGFRLHDLAKAQRPSYVASDFDPRTRKGWRGPYLNAVRVVGFDETMPPDGVADSFWLGDPWYTGTGLETKQGTQTQPLHTYEIVTPSLPTDPPLIRCFPIGSDTPISVEVR